jgi:hypothetical protein
VRIVELANYTKSLRTLNLSVRELRPRLHIENSSQVNISRIVGRAITDCSTQVVGDESTYTKTFFLSISIAESGLEGNAYLNYFAEYDNVLEASWNVDIYLSKPHFYAVLAAVEAGNVNYIDISLRLPDLHVALPLTLDNPEFYIEKTLDDGSSTCDGKVESLTVTAKEIKLHDDDIEHVADVENSHCHDEDDEPTPGPEVPVVAAIESLSSKVEKLQASVASVALVLVVLVLVAIFK